MHASPKNVLELLVNRANKFQVVSAKTQNNFWVYWMWPELKDSLNFKKKLQNRTTNNFSVYQLKIFSLKSAFRFRKN